MAPSRQLLATLALVMPNAGSCRLLRWAALALYVATAYTAIRTTPRGRGGRESADFPARMALCGEVPEDFSRQLLMFVSTCGGQLPLR